MLWNVSKRAASASARRAAVSSSPRGCEPSRTPDTAPPAPGLPNVVSDAASPVWRKSFVALFTLVAIAVSLGLRLTSWRIWGITADEFPLLAAIVLGGGPLVLELLRKLLRREFGSDLLAG